MRLAIRCKPNVNCPTMSVFFNIVFYLPNKLYIIIIIIFIKT